jgi:predicted MPP superfamily phosphohydrolase
MLLMVLSPLLVHNLERTGMDRAALLMAWPGYIWMGFLFLFVSTLLLTDLIYIVSRLTNRIFSSRPRKIPSAALSCKLALLTAVAASIYACFEANRIQSEHVTIRSAKLPVGASKIRIVQVSDIHIGLLLREQRLQRILRTVREAHPDILVSTGDLVDGQLSREEVQPHHKRLAAMLASVAAPSGKYAVGGNHEAYAGLRQAFAFTGSAGFTVLRNRSVTLPDGITITGVDDPSIPTKNENRQLTEKELLESAPKDTFHLLLKHRPFVLPESDGRFDLQLSGHVHKGQLFPFNFLVRLKHPIPCGTTTTRAGSYIHVSRGTGTWGPPMRLFAKPEITVIDIVPAAS